MHYATLPKPDGPSANSQGNPGIWNGRQSEKLCGFAFGSTFEGSYQTTDHKLCQGEVERRDSESCSPREAVRGAIAAKWAIFPAVFVLKRDINKI
jgi:hypothetical protein